MALSHVDSSQVSRFSLQVSPLLILLVESGSSASLISKTAQDLHHNELTA